jgi:hypothetical protein
VTKPDTQNYDLHTPGDKRGADSVCPESEKGNEMSEYTLPLETTKALWAYHKARHQIEGCKVPDNARIRFRNGSELGNMVLPLERLQDWHRKLGKDRLEITVKETGIALRCDLSRNVTSELVLHKQEGESDEVLELEAPHQGGEFIFKTELCVEKMVAEAAKKRMTEKARKHLTFVISYAREIRDRIKYASWEYRQAAAYMASKTLAQAVADARRKRKVLMFLRHSTDKPLEAPDWMTANGLWYWSMARTRLNMAERELAKYKPRIQRRFGTHILCTPRPIYGPKFHKLVEEKKTAEGRLVSVIEHDSERHLKRLGIHGYGWGYAHARTYTKNRKIVRAWPGIKARLVNEWKTALEEYRKAKATVKAANV